MRAPHARWPFETFYTGYRASVRRPDELIVAVEFRAVDGRQWWRKVGTRRAQAISKIMIAGVRGTDVRVAFGSVGPTVILATQAAAVLRRGGIDRRRAGGAAAGDCADRRHPFDEGLPIHGGGEPARGVLGTRMTQTHGRRRRVVSCLAAVGVRARRGLDRARDDGGARGAGAGRCRSRRATTGIAARRRQHDPLWMVRPLQPGDRTIDVLANPLNEVNQAKATRAMAQIERSIQAAQRRADLQYERAIAEAKRTGKSQDVDGVTLSDEGLAGARIDAELARHDRGRFQPAVVSLRDRLIQWSPTRRAWSSCPARWR